MVEQRLPHFGNHSVVERLAEIDPRKLGAESSLDAAHVNLRMGLFGARCRFDPMSFRAGRSSPMLLSKTDPRCTAY
jgi:hypothetical protein